jgi:16S rRNA (adenine1518-N6/adenine1519-N6)-dimethyltransferase
MGASVNVRDVLNGLGIDPKQSLGQNFMIEANALDRLAEAADLSPDDAVLEIGAGLGALTAVLAAQARRVVAVEIDGRFIPHLRSTFADTPGVEIVQADILEAEAAALMGPDAGDYRVVANVPYYITSAILRHLLENPTPPRVLVITVQREVAERITAGPGDMSLLAVSVQFYGEPQVITRLSRGNFYPQPNVESAILRVDARPGGPPLPLEEAERFFRLVRAGFSQPRKQVKNSLSAGLGVESKVAVGWLETAGIDPRRRPEKLAVDDWLRLYHAAYEA